jgi:hypothetical protein
MDGDFSRLLQPVPLTSEGFLVFIVLIAHPNYYADIHGEGETEKDALAQAISKYKDIYSDERLQPEFPIRVYEVVRKGDIVTPVMVWEV